MRHNELGKHTLKLSFYLFLVILSFVLLITAVAAWITYPSAWQEGSFWVYSGDADAAVSGYMAIDNDTDGIPDTGEYTPLSKDTLNAHSGYAPGASIYLRFLIQNTSVVSPLAMSVSFSDMNAYFYELLKAYKTNPASLTAQSSLDLIDTNSPMLFFSIRNIKMSTFASNPLDERNMLSAIQPTASSSSMNGSFNIGDPEITFSSFGLYKNGVHLGDNITFIRLQDGSYENATLALNLEFDTANATFELYDLSSTKDKILSGAYSSSVNGISLSPAAPEYTLASPASGAFAVGDTEITFSSFGLYKNGVHLGDNTAFTLSQSGSYENTSLGLELQFDTANETFALYDVSSTRDQIISGVYTSSSGVIALSPFANEYTAVSAYSCLNNQLDYTADGLLPLCELSEEQSFIENAVLNPSEYAVLDFELYYMDFAASAQTYIQSHSGYTADELTAIGAIVGEAVTQADIIEVYNTELERLIPDDETQEVAEQKFSISSICFLFKQIPRVEHDPDSGQTP